jgi:hypothetical protein
MAFYNPRNSLLDIEAMFIRHSVLNRPATDEYSANECLSIDFHFRISQEH